MYTLQTRELEKCPAYILFFIMCSVLVNNHFVQRHVANNSLNRKIKKITTSPVIQVALPVTCEIQTV